MMDEAAKLEDLEALVLLHDDLVVRDTRLLEKLRDVLADESIGVVGAIGARDVNSLRWWLGERRGRLSWNGASGLEHFRHFSRQPEDVETVDGPFLALSRWTVEELRFDSRRFEGFYGYAADLCFTVRRHGRRVVVADFELQHQNRPTGSPMLGEAVFNRNNRRWRAKWGFESRAALPIRLMRLRLAVRWPTLHRLYRRWLRRD
jgi:hypothetical protein